VISFTARACQKKEIILMDSTSKKGKIIWIDWSVFVHRSIFASENCPDSSVGYLAMNSLIACLSRIGVHANDTVVVAMDTGKSWRKKIDPEYKANRKAAREAHEKIDWTKCFAAMNDLRDTLNDATPWRFVGIDSIEADDIMAEGVRYFTDYDHVIVSHDADLEQLFIYPNVNIFSPAAKPPRYKVRLTNPLELLMKKIRLETSDNLITKLVSERDYDKRKSIVSLLELPAWLKLAVADKFKTFNEPKIYNDILFPFDSLKPRYDNLNDSNKLMTYEDSRKLEERRAKRSAKKKVKNRRNRG
jgi:hypothetical protein